MTTDGSFTATIGTVKVTRRTYREAVAEALAIAKSEGVDDDMLIVSGPGLVFGESATYDR